MPFFMVGVPNKLRKPIFCFDFYNTNTISKSSFIWLNLILCEYSDYLFKCTKNDSREFVEFGILSSFKYRNILGNALFNYNK